MIKAIVCVDENWGIGKDNDLLFSLPTDMKFFRQTTLGKTVVFTEFQNAVPDAAAEGAEIAGIGL